MESTCKTCGQPVPNSHGLAIDDERGEVRFAGKVVQFSRHQHRLFAALARRAGRATSKENLSAAIYFDHHGGDVPDDKIIDVMVCKMRPKLAAIGLELKTHRGRGYELIVPGMQSLERDVPITAGDLATLSYGGPKS